MYTLSTRASARTVAAMLAVAGLVHAPAPAEAATSGKALILSTTVSGGMTSNEAVQAQSLGLTVEVKSASEWAAMSASQFDDYRVIILGDANCPGVSAANPAATNRAVWSSVVNGNIAINGTDPSFHRHQGGGQLTKSSIAFAADAAGKTGAYISLSCYYHGAASGTPVPLLDGFGSFKVTGVGCFNDAHIVATHPSLAGLTDASLSNWNCSVHEAFTAWPDSFSVLAVARNAPGATYRAADGTLGTPYILARGEGLSTSNIQLSPASASAPIGGSHTLTATVTDGGTPEPGQLVTFTATGGPNSGTTGSSTTGPDGRASFTYSSSTAGTDTWTASFTDLGLTQTSNTAEIEWVGAVDEPPTATVDSVDPEGDEGSPIELLGTVVDDQPGVTSSWTQDASDTFDAGAACTFSDPTSPDTTVTCTDDGVFHATLTATDSAGQATTSTVHVHVRNVAPTVDGRVVSPTSAVACPEGNVVTVAATASDAGANDSITGAISWGDGTTTDGFTGTRTLGPGTHDISVVATDDDLASSEASAATSSVSLLYSGGSVLQPINADGSSNFKRGRTVPVKIRPTGCSGGSVSGLAPVVNLERISTTPSGEVNEVSSSAADTGVVMREVDGGYLYNLSTKLSTFNSGQDLAAGRYKLTITESRMMPIVAYFDLRD